MQSLFKQPAGTYHFLLPSVTARESPSTGIAETGVVRGKGDRAVERRQDVLADITVTCQVSFLLWIFSLMCFGLGSVDSSVCII